MSLRKFLKYMFMLMFSLTLGISIAGAQVALDSVPGKFELGPSPLQVMVAKNITAILAQSHYKKVSIDDSLSVRVFNNYLAKLDKAHVLFLASDISQFEKYRFQMDDALLTGDLSVPFELFNVYADRLYTQLESALKTLETKQNLSSADTFDFTRAQLPWFNAGGAAENYWNKRLRYELIALTVANKDEKKAYEILARRYEKMEKALTALNGGYVLDLFMNAFTEAIDPHTVYFSPKRSDDFHVMMNKSLEGIGMTFSVEDDFPVIRSVVKGGPADKSNEIAVNDRILAIAEGQNGAFEDVVGWDQDEVVRRIKGVKGTVVRLQILVAGAALVSKPKIVSLIRDKIVLEDQKVKSEVRLVNQGQGQKKIGIIYIPGFYFDQAAFNKGDKDYASTSEDVKKALESFKAQGVEGVIIDLRNNGGGALREAVALTGLFIKQGPVVQIRNAQNKTVVQSDTDGLALYAGPLAVLVNRYSASASEIFSAALQDYGRAVIIGEQTFGKGTVQNVYPLNSLLKFDGENLGSLSFTTDKFYRINGASTQHHGVSPDLHFSLQDKRLTTGESTLKNALPYDEIAATVFSPVSRLGEVNKVLEKHHQERMNANLGYRSLIEELQKDTASDLRKPIVLDLKKFAALQETAQKEDLNRLNLRRKFQGLKPVTVIGDRAKSNLDDVMEESLKITAELSGLVTNDK